MQKQMHGGLVRTCAFFAGITLFAIPVALSAQRVRGIVRDSTSALPLPGAVVAVVDSAGQTTARTIADAAGGFTLPLTPAAARLHVIRIGYGPRDIRLPSVRPGVGAEVSLGFAMFRLPPVLSAVRVSSTELCPGSKDRGAAFQLWEQARAGLLATIVAREAKPASATTLVFERGMAPNDNLIRRQKVEVKTGRTTKPFIAAAPPSTFAKRGYVDEESSSARVYSMPDEDVLLDESFAATHCFHLQPSDQTHDGQVGLAFTPIGGAGRDTIVDVSGVIWIDRANPALRTLEFRYTGLEPAAERAGTGGYLDFRSMPNGVAFIEYWTLRMPVMIQEKLSQSTSSQAMRPDVPRGSRRQDRLDVRVTEMVEAGGQVLYAKWDDGPMWEAPRTGLTGTIVQRGSQAPVAYALVTLRGTPDTTTTDSLGRFILAPIVAGRYSVVSVDTALADFTTERTDTRAVDVPRGGLVPFHAELTPLPRVVADLCKGQRSGAFTATIVGRVAPVVGALAADADIKATWESVSAVSETIVARSSDRHSSLDGRGRFVICGVPVERPIRVALSQGTVFADTTVRLPDRPVVSIDWRPRFHSITAERAEPSSDIPAKLREFEERRKRGGGGVFLDEAFLRQRDGKRLGDVLRTGVRGLRVLEKETALYAVSSHDERIDRLASQDPAGSAPCFTTVYVDGVLLFDKELMRPATLPPGLNEFPLENLVGVEFYAVGTTPPERFRNGPCGSLLLWMRPK